MNIATRFDTLQRREILCFIVEIHAVQQYRVRDKLMRIYRTAVTTRAALVLNLARPPECQTAGGRDYATSGRTAPFQKLSGLKNTAHGFASGIHI